jgi:hypothetical protein
MTQPTEYSSLTISWEADAEGNRLVLIECRGDDGAPLWQHTMPMLGAAAFGNSLTAAGTMPVPNVPTHQPEVEDLWPMSTDPTQFHLREHVPHAMDLEITLD